MELMKKYVYSHQSARRFRVGVAAALAVVAVTGCGGDSQAPGVPDQGASVPSASSEVGADEVTDPEAPASQASTGVGEIVPAEQASPGQSVEGVEEGSEVVELQDDQGDGNGPDLPEPSAPTTSIPDDDAPEVTLPSALTGDDADGSSSAEDSGAPDPGQITESNFENLEVAGQTALDWAEHYWGAEKIEWSRTRSFNQDGKDYDVGSFCVRVRLEDLFGRPLPDTYWGPEKWLEFVQEGDGESLISLTHAVEVKPTGVTHVDSFIHVGNDDVETCAGWFA